MARLLAPVVSTQILCIGLNYRRHTQEAGAKIPDHLVLFVKGVNTLFDPGEPILIPTYLDSREVDYERDLPIACGPYFSLPRFRWDALSRWCCLVTPPSTLLVISLTLIVWQNRFHTPFLLHRFIRV